MKIKLSKLAVAYKALGEAKVTKLDEKDVVKIVKNRRAMRQYAEDYEAFLKDAQDKFKPENWDDVQKKLQQWQNEGNKTTLSDEDKITVNKALNEYQKKIESAIKEEGEKEIELNLETLSEDSSTKILVENGWKVEELDKIECVL